MILRLSQKLATRIKAGRLEVLPLHENPLTDWSAHLFMAARTQYILLANTKSLICTVVPGKGITSGDDLSDLAIASIHVLMEAAGYESVFERQIAPACDAVLFAKALDRSITGSMNDMVKHATFYLVDYGLSPSEVAGRLSECPMSALRRSGSPYGFPRDVFKELVEGNPKWA